MTDTQKKLMSQVEAVAATVGIEVSTYPVGDDRCVVSTMDDSDIPDSFDSALQDAGITIRYAVGAYPNTCEFAEAE